VARIEELNVMLVDDLDGGRATETVAFALEGSSYEIDLSKRNADKLRRSLRPYLESGRRVKRGPQGRAAKRASRASAGHTEDYDRAEVRAWAKSHRIKVAPRGRISNDIVERWRQSNGG
jgi:Lsr2